MSYIFISITFSNITLKQNFKIVDYSLIVSTTYSSSLSQYYVCNTKAISWEYERFKSNKPVFFIQFVQKRLNFCNKNVISVLTTYCIIPFKVFLPTGNAPHPAFLQILERFAEHTFRNGAQLVFHIFLDLL